MAFDHKDIYELSGDDNPVVPYDVFDSRRILGLAAYTILCIRPDCAHVESVVARFTRNKQTEAVIRQTLRLAWYLVDSEEEIVFWRIVEVLMVWI